MFHSWPIRIRVVLTFIIVLREGHVLYCKYKCVIITCLNPAFIVEIKHLGTNNKELSARKVENKTYPISEYNLCSGSNSTVRNAAFHRINNDSTFTGFFLFCSLLSFWKLFLITILFLEISLVFLKFIRKILKKCKYKKNTVRIHSEKVCIYLCLIVGTICRYWLLWLS